MADPVTLAVVGAVGGAMMNKKDPIKGALVGGTLGFGGGTLLGPALGASAPGIAGGAAGTAGAGTAANAAYGALPGMTAGSQQAAMLAAQTAPMGLPGYLSTGAAASGAQGVSPMTASLFDFGAKASLPMSGTQAAQLNMASGMVGRGQPQQQQQPQMPPPQVSMSRRQPSQYPTLNEMYKMQMAQAAPRFSLI